MKLTAFRATAVLVAVVSFPSLASATGTPIPAEGVFAPLAPCRIYKSVTANNNTPLPANSNATVYVTGLNSYANQGGPSNSTGCGVPASATSVTVSVTTSHATSTGTLNAFVPGNSSSTPGTAITFSPSLSQTTGLAIGLSYGSFQVEPVGGATNVTVDVTGYWAPQIEAYINSNGTTYSQTGRITSSIRNSAGNYEIDIDRDVSTCAASAAVVDAGYYSSTATYGSAVAVQTWRLSSSAAVVYTDEYFNVIVAC